MYRYGCISVQRYWSSLRYSFLRTLFLLAADYVVIHCLQHSASPRPRSHGLRVIPRAVFLACFYKSIYRHLGNTPPRSTV